MVIFESSRLSNARFSRRLIGNWHRCFGNSKNVVRGGCGISVADRSRKPVLG
jgi:hypothetical protein